MNIFILDEDPVRAAQLQCDKHVVKMVLETAQILSTISGGPYKPTHRNHPCTRWAAESVENYNWLVTHGLELSREYTRRFGKKHKSEAVIIACSVPNHDIFDTGFRTPFVLAMPDECKDDDAVLAYQNYYRYKDIDVGMDMRWTGREVPEFML